LEIKQNFVSHKGDPHNELGSWVDDRASNCCGWNKVRCSSGHITELSLNRLWVDVPFPIPSI